MRTSEHTRFPVTGASNYERLLGGRVVVFLLRVATLTKKEMAERKMRSALKFNLHSSFHLQKRNVPEQTGRGPRWIHVCLAHHAYSCLAQSLVPEDPW